MLHITPFPKHEWHPTETPRHHQKESTQQQDHKAHPNAASINHPGSRFDHSSAIRTLYDYRSIAELTRNQISFVSRNDERGVITRIDRDSRRTMGFLRLSRVSKYMDFIRVVHIAAEIRFWIWEFWRISIITILLESHDGGKSLYGRPRKHNTDCVDSNEWRAFWRLRFSRDSTVTYVCQRTRNCLHIASKAGFTVNIKESWNARIYKWLLLTVSFAGFGRWQMSTYEYNLPRPATQQKPFFRLSKTFRPNNAPKNDITRRILTRKISFPALASEVFFNSNIIRMGAKTSKPSTWNQ